MHSKVTVIDDRLLRVGSSNLNNRSMGVDTECDLTIEADRLQDGVRQTILRIRNDLIAEHLGVPRDHLAAAIRDCGSLVQAIDDLSGESERQLASFPPPSARSLHWVEHNPLTDPIRPLGSRRRLPPHRAAGRAVGVAVLAASGLFLAGYLIRRWRKLRPGLVPADQSP